MSIMPHNHTMWAVIGIYSGVEDNIFGRRTAGERALRQPVPAHCENVMRRRSGATSSTPC
jgi:predicted metal-dependent enzyme (double-stranded beta helix superfamily)